LKVLIRIIICLIFLCLKSVHVFTSWKQKYTRLLKSSIDISCISHFYRFTVMDTSFNYMWYVFVHHCWSDEPIAPPFHKMLLCKNQWYIYILSLGTLLNSSIWHIKSLNSSHLSVFDHWILNPKYPYHCILWIHTWKIASRLWGIKHLVLQTQRRYKYHRRISINFKGTGIFDLNRTQIYTHTFAWSEVIDKIEFWTCLYCVESVCFSSTFFLINFY
jgi:hypothetical protein